MMTTVEVTRDAKSEAWAHEIPLAEHHQLLGSYPWLEWLQLKTRNPRLFVLRNTLSSSFVLAVWVYSPEETDSPVFTELCSFTSTPTWMWPADLPDPWVLLRRLRPVDVVVDEMRAQRDAARASEQAGKAADLEHRTSVARWLRRRGMEREAHDLSTGATPFVGPSRDASTNEMWKDALLTARRST